MLENSSENTESTETVVNLGGGAKRPASIPILFYDEEGNAPESFAKGLSVFGYYIESADQIDKLEWHMLNEDFAFLIVRLHQNRPETIRAIARLVDAAPEARIVFIADQATVEMRMQALRAGVKIFLVAPVEATELVDHFMAFGDQSYQRPVRVLLVEADIKSARFHETLLTNHGMDVRLCEDWRNLIENISDFRPEIIVIDHYFDDTDGAELAAIIRMDIIHDAIPIIFLSDFEHGLEEQYLMATGGDEFLTRPIPGRQFVASIKNRVQRFRRIRSGITMDSLTGLLNHTTLERRVDAEVARAIRNNKPLSFAMIDLDHFKMVNDKYGHAYGDQVLKYLSHLLRRRLRQSDIVGRYGGEEFGVALPGTSAPDAVMVIDEIREALRSVRFGVQENIFYVSFSSGVSSLDNCKSTSDLIETADQALYRAKIKGRNQVLIGRKRLAHI